MSIHICHTFKGTDVVLAVGTGKTLILRTNDIIDISNKIDFVRTKIKNFTVYDRDTESKINRECAHLHVSKKVDILCQVKPITNVNYLYNPKEYIVHFHKSSQCIILSLTDLENLLDEIKKLRKMLRAKGKCFLKYKSSSF